MKEFLVDFWQIAFGVSVSVGISAIVIQYYFRKTDSIAIFCFNFLVFLALCTWLGSYALATRLEVESLALSFPNDELTGPDISVVFHAISLAVAFGLLLVFHRLPLVVVLLIIAVGIADWSGNSLLIQSMRERAVMVGGHRNLPVGQEIWHNYYVFGEHLFRITVYTSIAFIALIVFFMANIHIVRVEVLRKNFGEPLANAFRSLAKFQIPFSVLCRLLIVGAIVINEAWIWDIRIEREKALSCYSKSIFYQWSLNRIKDGFDCQAVEKQFGKEM